MQQRRRSIEVYAHFAPDALKRAADERAKAMREAMEDKPKEKKEYARPAIVYTTALEGRAVLCAKSDDIICAGGPIQS